MKQIIDALNSLAGRVRAGSEAAPWVAEEIQRIRELVQQALTSGSADPIEQAIRTAIAETREECARVCEGAIVCTDRPDAHWAKLCAAAIRAKETR